MPTLAASPESYAALAATILILLLLAIALFRDGPKGRRRCPRCWYDMSATEGRRCPECGREARSERALRRTRRRWRIALLCIPLLAGAWLLHRLPEINKRGMIAAAPTTLLIPATAIWNKPNYSGGTVTIPGGQVTSQRWMGGPRAPANVDAHIAVEVRARVAADSMWDWQTRWLINVATDRRNYLFSVAPSLLRAHPPHTKLGRHLQRRLVQQYLDPGLTFRDRWPAGEPVWVRVDPSAHLIISSSYYVRFRPTTPGLTEFEATIESLNSQIMTTYLVPPDRAPDTEIGTPPAGTSTLRYTMDVHAMRGHRPDWPLVDSRALELDLAPAAHAHDIITPVQDERIAAAVSQELFTTVYRDPDTLEPRVRVFAETPLLDDLLERNLALGVIIELHHGDEIVASTKAWTELHTSPYPTNGEASRFLALVAQHHTGEFVEERLAWRVSLPPFRFCDQTRLIVRSDPNVALRDFEAKQYWQGVVDLTTPPSYRYPCEETDHSNPAPQDRADPSPPIPHTEPSPPGISQRPPPSSPSPTR